MPAFPRWLIALLAFAALLAAGIVVLTLRYAPTGAPAPTPPRPHAQRVPELPADAIWLGGGPMNADSLAGRPVAFVVWSDTDPRSLALLPLAEGWHRAYGRYGVRVIGVHTPIFSFGADSAIAAGVRRRLDLTFPVVLDPGYAVERALETTERPTIVVADGSGDIRLATGAAGLDDVDRLLRDLVRAGHPKISFPEGPAGSASASGPPAELEFVFLGTARVTRGPLANATPGRAQTFTAQFRFQEEGEPLVPYPVGRWTPSAEGLTSERGGAAEYVAVRTDGGDVDVVMGSAPARPARAWVLGDDEWLAPETRGDDVRVDARGATYLDVTEPRLYSLARGAVRVLKLSPETPGITIYCFAVGRK